MTKRPSCWGCPMAEHDDSEPYFEAFRDEPPLRPMPPLEALRYFLGLSPKLGVDPERWGEAHERHAFTLAADVNGIVLDRVQEVLASILRSGDVPKGPALVDAILDEAGLSPRDPSYGELVVRTNLMDAYSTGATREMQHPDVRDTFPVWKYLGIHDGRQRKSHEVHFDKYFPNEVTFAEVRDSILGKFDGFRCRCFPQAIDKFTWAELQANGHDVAKYSESTLADFELT